MVEPDHSATHGIYATLFYLIVTDSSPGFCIFVISFISPYPFPMEPNPTPNANPLQNAPNTHDQPAAKTNEDFNKKVPLPSDPDLHKTQPEADTPVILAEEEEEEKEQDSANETIDQEDSFTGTASDTYLDIIDE